MFKKLFTKEKEINEDDIKELMKKHNILFVFFFDVAKKKQDFAFVQSALELLEIQIEKNITQPTYAYDSASNLVTVLYNID